MKDSCQKITERYCSEVGENVVLRSTSPDFSGYECLHSPFCAARDKCPRSKKQSDEQKN